MTGNGEERHRLWEALQNRVRNFRMNSTPTITPMRAKTRRLHGRWCQGEADIRRLVETAVRCCLVLDTLTRPAAVTGQAHVNGRPLA